MPPKKAAKKSVKHHDPKRHEAKDLRRAYEHLGRVEILQLALRQTHVKHVTTLAALAEQELQSGHIKDAADLLRAAEHLSFAALAGDNAKVAEVSKDLENAIAEEFEHLTLKAEEHWEHDEERHGVVAALYESSLKSSKKALQQGTYRQALELMRAAEALAHVKKHGPNEVQDVREKLELSAS